MLSLSSTISSSSFPYGSQVHSENTLPHQSIAAHTTMAPRKLAVDDEASNKKIASAVKKNNDKVVKRPVRGYHKFRNGLLNVMPKGGEKEM